MREKKHQLKNMHPIFIILLFAVWLFPMYGTHAYAASDGAVKEAGLGIRFSAALKNDGSVWTWGNNNFGQLGNGTRKSHLTPKKIMSNVKHLSAAEYYCAAIKKDDSLWMWGSIYVQVGNKKIEKSRSPVKIMDNVKSVSLGYSHTAVLKKDGTLWMWGNNTEGQLGKGKKTKSYVYAPMKIMKNVKSISLGDKHSAAIKKDDTLWMWGDNSRGQLGDGKTKDSAAPVKIMSSVKSVSLGYNHSAAIKKDGTLWIWGENTGSKAGKDNRTPKKILSNVKSVSLGNGHSAAVKKDGSLWIWGADSYWKTGIMLPDNMYRVDTPTKLMNNVKSVSLGYEHSAAIKKDGSLWMWGDNYYGQLGDGTKIRPETAILIIANSAKNSKTWKVTFKDGTKTVKTQKVANGKSAAAPKLTKAGYKLLWDQSFDKVTKNLTVNTVWRKTENIKAASSKKQSVIADDLKHPENNIDMEEFSWWYNENMGCVYYAITVKNYNKTVEADHLSIRVTAYDKKGTVLKTRKETLRGGISGVLYPQKKYTKVSQAFSLAEKPYKVTCEFVEKKGKIAGSYYRTRTRFTDLKVKSVKRTLDQNGNTKFIIKIANPNNVEITNTELNVIYFDANNQIVGGESWGGEGNITANSTIEVERTDRVNNGLTYASYKIYTGYEHEWGNTYIY